MTARAERLGTRIAAQLTPRARKSDLTCPFCRHSPRSARRFHLQSNLLRPAADTQQNDTPIPATLTEIASSEKWQNAYRRSLQPLQGIASTGLQDTSDLAKALNRKDGRLVFKALQKHEDDPEYFQSLTASTWTEIWRVINPQLVYPSLHRIHRSSNQAILQGITREGFFAYERSRDFYMEKLATLIDIRRRYGPPLDIVDYRTILTYIARIGDLAGARTIWADMKEDNVRPDRDCYNRFMEAIVWDEAGRQRQARKAKDTRDRLRPQFTDIVLFKPGLSAEITQLFNEMATYKIAPDVATLCVLMTALARDGEFEEVTKLLKRVWSVDTDALLKGTEVGNLQRIYEPSSPLFPTDRLLVTIAEVYGLANEIPAGLRTLTYLAAQYNMRLPENVWYQVIRWAWLQARLKPHERRTSAGGTQLNMESVNTIIQIMDSEEPAFERSIELSDISFKTLMDSPFAFDHSFQPDAFLEILNSGRKKLAVTERGYHRSRAHVRYAIARTKAGEGGQAYYRTNTYNANEAYVHYRRQLSTIRHWVKRIIALPRAMHGMKDHILRERDNAANSEEWTRAGLNNLMEWRLRGFQNFVSQFHAYMPRTVGYTMDTGFVELNFIDDDEEEDGEVLDTEKSAEDLKKEEKKRISQTITARPVRAWLNKQKGTKTLKFGLQKSMPSSQSQVDEKFPK